MRAEVEAAVAAEPLITGFGLAAGTGEAGTGEGAGTADLAVRLHLAPDDGQPAGWQQAVNRAASRIAGRLAPKACRGHGTLSGACRRELGKGGR